MCCYGVVDRCGKGGRGMICSSLGLWCLVRVFGAAVCGPPPPVNFSKVAGPCL